VKTPEFAKHCILFFVDVFLDPVPVTVHTFSDNLKTFKTMY
jgi:hypothetical protein